MILPRGTPIHEYLNTSFVQVGALIDELKSNHLTGYLRLVGWSYDGVLVFDTGSIVNAVDELDGTRRCGDIAAQTIAAKAREKEGAVSVYRLSDEMAQVLAGLGGEPSILSGTIQDQADLRKLVSKLEEDALTGYVEIKVKGNTASAALFLRQGQLIDSAWSKGQVPAEGEGLESTLWSAGQPGSSYSVYAVDVANAYSRHLVLSDETIGPESLELWAQVLALMEAAVDRRLKPGSFRNAFKWACIQHASEFPFLDPFAGEFEFKDGQVRYEGKTGSLEFNRGLSQCLARAVERLTEGPRGDQLVAELAAGMAKLKEDRGSRLDELQLTRAVPRLFEP